MRSLPVRLPLALGSAATRARLVAPAAALAAAGTALVALARRWHERDTGDPSEVVMVAPSALGLLLAAAALLLVLPWRGAPARAAGRLAATASLLIGVAALVPYIADWQGGTGLAPTLAGGAWWARRPGPTTAIGLMLISAALLALATGPLRRWASLVAAGTLVAALVAGVGHLYDASALYGRNPWGGTAVSTTFALGALALGVIFADPSRGVAAVVASGSAGARLLRRLLPAALVAPPVLGGLALMAEEAGWVGVRYGTALLVVALMVLLGGLAVQHGKAVHAADAERERLLARERAARARATTILESITDGFFAVDRAWRFTYVNSEAERLLQQPREALLGRELWEAFPEAVGSTFQVEYERAMVQQATVRFEAHHAPLGIWVDVRAFPSADGLSVYFHDVTARRLAEQRLRESEESYRLVADMIPQHIWTTDAAGYHTYFSRRWFEFSGTTLEQAGGEGWLALLHPEDRERTLARWRHSLATGEPYSIEYRFRRAADGEWVWFWGQAMPLRDEDGRIVRWFGTLTDISERKRLEAERERMAETRARLMRGFSHDVRNPLSVADAQAWMLEDGRRLGALTGAQRESVQRIRRAIRSSVRLIDDLLDLARADAGEIDLRSTATDVGQAAREVAEDFRPQAFAVGLALEVRARPGLELHTDPARLRQVLGNLLSNAVKYAPQGRLTVDAARRDTGGPRPGSWAAVSVADTGPGIPPEQRERIFEEYTRLAPAAQPGAGIGLAISRRIARLMGGELTVESEPGHGATFTLWLPLAGGDADA